jgi:hypothetical protein
MCLYGKKVEGKYYYFVSLLNKDYTDTDFEKSIRKKVDVSKHNNLAFEHSEEIYKGMYLTKYLSWKDKKHVEELDANEKAFWDLHSYSKYRETRDMSDLPSEYILIDYLKETDGKYYKLLCKKNNNEYNYLVSKQLLYNKETINTYYRPMNFSESEYTLCTKSDYSKFTHDELIDGMFQVSYLEKLSEEKRYFQKQQKNDFLKKNICTNYTLNFNGDIFDDSEICDEYLPVNYLICDDDESWIKYILYCKKVRSDYYYLVDNDSHSWSENFVHFYEPGFTEKAKTLQNLTKKNKSKYDPMEKFVIICNGQSKTAHTETYRNNKIEQRVKWNIKMNKLKLLVPYLLTCILVGGAIAAIGAIGYRSKDVIGLIETKS